MIERVKLLMSVKNLSSSDFAASIQVQRSGISHILSGRNKPSLDFIMKVLEAFPEVNETWLLFGKDEMFKNSHTQQQTDQALITSTSEEISSNFEDKGEEDPIEGFILKQEEEPYNESTTKNTILEKSETMPEQKGKESAPQDAIKHSNSKKIVKLLAIYSDNSFEEFYLND